MSNENFTFYKGKRVFITGGAGFIGRSLAVQLHELGADVLSVSRKIHPELAALGIQHEILDLATASQDAWQLLEGTDIVFHVAAKVDMWGRYDDFYAVNVQGTENLLHACTRYRVPALVYTSSPSVIADGSDLRGIDESYPYPEKHHAHYPATKAMAERSVLETGKTRSLATVSLRPHLVWGPGDQNFVPLILARAKAGRLFRVGQGKNLVDLSFIDDCVQAHLLAGQALWERPEKIRGEAFFISQEQPVPLWDWIDEVLLRNRLKTLDRSLSKPLALFLAGAMEWISCCSPFSFKPLLTRFLVEEMTTDHYFSIEKARRLLGYHPRYSIEEALDLTFPR